MFAYVPIESRAGVPVPQAQVLPRSVDGRLVAAHRFDGDVGHDVQGARSWPLHSGLAPGNHARADLGVSGVTVGLQPNRRDGREVEHRIGGE